MFCATCTQMFAAEAEASKLYIHHEDIHSLSRSSESGCSVCQLLLDYIKHPVKKKWPADWVSRASHPFRWFPISWQFEIEVDSQSQGFLRFCSSGYGTHLGFDLNLAENEGAAQTDISHSTLNHTSRALTGKWLKECAQHHTRCKTGNLSSPSNAAFRPTRLLEVGSENGKTIRLVQSKDVQSTAAGAPPYITLSHCWGKADFLQLKPENKLSLESGFSVEILPQTFQDAIKIVRELRVGYLWIDSLCIIQGPNGDWATEASVMHLVYKHAWLNISAAGAKDSSGGMIFERLPATVSRPLVSPSWIDFPRGQYVLTVANWFQDLDKSTLNQRAWVLQERLLAPRVLHFGKSQLIWECNELMACELHPDGVTWGSSGDPFYYHLKAYLKLDDAESLRISWMEILRTYSSAALTKYTDRLPALAGIVAELQEDGTLAPENRYLAGMWQADLPLSLLWYVVEGKQGNQQPAYRPKTYRAPSWSWTSVEGDINSLADFEAEDTRIFAVVSSVDVQAGDRIGVLPIEGGQLRLTGPFGKAKWEDHLFENGLGVLPRLTSVVDVDGVAWPCTASDSAAFSTIRFDTPETATPAKDLYCLAIEGSPDSLDHAVFLEVRGLLMVEVGDQAPRTFQRVGVFSLGSTWLLDLAPNFPNPTFARLQEQEIVLI